MTFKIIDQDGTETIIDDLEAKMKERHDNLITDPVIVEKLRGYLGNSGRECFQEYLETHGEVCPVFVYKGIPYAVHFREGMQVRNFLRGLDECKDWTHDQFEEDYVKYIEEAIK